MTVLDLKQIKFVIQEEINPLKYDLDILKKDVSGLKQDVKIVKMDLRKIKNDLDTTIRFFDRDILHDKKRLDRIEANLHLPRVADF